MIVLTAPSLASTNIAHGFFGRTGGVSQGIFASLNCGPGSGDARENVVENRRRVAEALAPGAALLTLYQIHSGDAVTVTAPWNIGEGPKADAMATNVPGLPLGILTADCAPVLLADSDAGVIGAARANRRGDRTVHLPGELRDRPRIPRAIPASVLRRTPVRSRSLRRGAARGRAHPKRRTSRRLHLRARGGFLQLSPRHPSRRSGLRETGLGNRAADVKSAVYPPHRTC
jgi:hypothetical protein